jgi:hypothetical protein
VHAAPVNRLSVYKTKAFARFARKARIGDDDLRIAANFANSGLIDADLGGGVIKQRIPRSGEGKSGGSRSIILFRKDDRAVYVYGFEKKDKSNIDRRELEALRELAQVVLGYTNSELDQQVRNGALIHIPEMEETNAPKISQ